MFWVAQNVLLTFLLYLCADSGVRPWALEEILMEVEVCGKKQKLY